MADNNKKKYIKYEDTTYILQDSRIPDPSSADNGKVLGVVSGEYALKQEEGGSGAVTSVNGKTGTVVLDAEDVGAYTKPASGIPASDLANDMPFFTLPEGGQSGQALVSDGEGGAEWGNPPSSGSGLTEEVKQALLECFANVAWANTSGASCYEALAEAFDAEPVIPGALPSGFTKYDYIESTVASDRTDAPTGGLIELKYYTDLNQYGADFYFGFTTGVRSGGGPIFGGRPRSEQKTQSYAFYCNGSSLAMHGHGTDTGFKQPISTTPNTKHHCVYTNTAQSPSEYVVDDNQPYSFAWSNELTIPSKLYVNSNLGLFKGTQSGEIKLKNLDGTIADRYIPCVRDSDNVIGMYEVIHGVFYTAASAQYATIGNANCLYKVGNWG